MLESILSAYKFLRNFGFGAVLGLAIGFIIYPYVQPNLRDITEREFLAFCAFVGGVIETGIMGIWKMIVPPTVTFVGFYEGILELVAAAAAGLLPEGKAQEMIEELFEKRFLGGPSKTRTPKLKPAGTKQLGKGAKKKESDDESNEPE